MKYLNAFSWLRAIPDTPWGFSSATPSTAPRTKRSLLRRAAGEGELQVIAELVKVLGG